VYLDNGGLSHLDSEQNILNKLGITKPSSGSNEATVEKLNPVAPYAQNRVPDPIKEVIGTIARIESPAAAAAAFNVVSRTAYDYARGIYDGHHQYDLDKLNRVKNNADRIITDIRKVALDKLMQSIEVITPEKLEACKAVEASQVARNLSAVHEKLAEKQGVNVNGNVIFLTPRVRSQRDYDEVLTAERVG